MTWNGPALPLVAVLAVVVGLLPAGTTATASVAGRTGAALTDPRAGWLPADFEPSPLNPVHSFGPQPGQQGTTDRVFPTVMRVDDKLANPMGRWYLWVWRHGKDPRTADNGGRLLLLTADRLKGPWTSRGFVTPENMSPEGWGPYSWTGGDVVWSARHRKFFSVPHAYRTGRPGLDSFLMESVDGVSWQLSDVPQPVLPAGPEWYDSQETGYGKLLVEAGPDQTERWTWLYRSNRRDPTTASGRYYTFSVASAGDVYGPWRKATFNPVFDPFVNNAAAPESAGGLIGMDAFVEYQGYYQLLWQNSFGEIYLSRSDDLRQWEEFLPQGTQDTRPFGDHRSLAFYVGKLPHEVVIVGGDLVYDHQVGALTLLYLAWDADQVRGQPGRVSVNLARSVTGGEPIAD